MFTQPIKGKLIVIEGVQDLTRLLDWRDEHPELVRNFRPVIREGIIEYGEGGEGGVYRQEFKAITDDIIRHEYLAAGILKGFGFEYDRRTWEVQNVYGTVTFYPVEFAIQDMITVHASVMAILEHAKQFAKEEDNKITIKVK